MELLRALAAVAEPPSPALAPVATALELGPIPSPEDHTDLLILQLVPYASVYLNEDGMLGGRARDRIDGFLRALRLPAHASSDHLGHLLGLAASLIELEAGADDPRGRDAAQRARAALLHEHLMSWVPAYLDAVDRVVRDGHFYRAWSTLLQSALESVTNDGEGFEQPARHLLRAPVLPDPRESDAKTFLAGLLAPAVSGMVIARDDLARCAQDVDVGIRKGERRFVLKTLLGQDDAAILDWLAGEAARQASQHGTRSGANAHHWQTRAESSHRLLADLAKAARQDARCGVDQG